MEFKLTLSSPEDESVANNEDNFLHCARVPRSQQIEKLTEYHVVMFFTKGVNVAGSSAVTPVLQYCL